MLMMGSWSYILESTNNERREFQDCRIREKNVPLLSTVHVPSASLTFWVLSVVGAHKQSHTHTFITELGFSL